MKKLLSAVVFTVFAVVLSGAELAVNFKDALAKTPPMAGAVKGWVRNGNAKTPDIGNGEVTEEDGVACFKIETTRRNTEFYLLKSFKARAGQTLEFEITAQGKGYLLSSCYSYEASKKFFASGTRLQYSRLNGQKKVYKTSIKLLDGKKGEKLDYILLSVGAADKSEVTVFDIKARITDGK